MIIYLASFPRSGNTMCRQLVIHYFDRLSTSVYDETIIVSRDKLDEEYPVDTDKRFRVALDRQQVPYRIVAPDVQNIFDAKFRKELAASPEVFFIKTHELPYEKYFEGEYVIRIVRHPAVALWSYYNYLSGYERKTAVLQEVIKGTADVLNWSYYTNAWFAVENQFKEHFLKIKYESLIDSEELLVAKVQELTGLSVVNPLGSFPDFEHWHKSLPQFYRSGKANEWKDKLAPDDIMLIYQCHAQAMALEGYEFDFAPPPYSVDYKTRIHLAQLGMTDTANMVKVDAAGQVVKEGNLRYQVMFNGVKVPADGYYGPWYTELIQKCNGHHEPQEEYVFDQLVKNAPDGATMIELGSYWAFYSAWFLTHVSNSQAILVEPYPDNIAASLATLSLNKCRANIELAAVGARDKIFENIFIGGAQQPNYETPMLTVDELIESYGIQRLYILHSDIQGAELKMLEGAANALENHKIDYLVISTHSEELHHQCLQKLETFNYHIVAEHDIYESYTYDGLIVARSEQAHGPDKLAIHKRTAAEWTWEEAKKAWADKEIYLSEHQKILHTSELRPALSALQEQVREAAEAKQLLEQELFRLQELISIRERDHQARAEKLHDLALQVENLDKAVNNVRARKISKIMRRLGKPLI